LLLSNSTCLVVNKENMSSCQTRAHGSLSSKKLCLLVEQPDMPSWSTRKHLPVQQEGMSSYSARKHVSRFNKKPCALVRREDMSSCSTKRRVLLLNENSVKWRARAGMPFGAPDWTPKLEYHFAPIGYSGTPHRRRPKPSSTPHMWGASHDLPHRASVCS